MTIELNHTIVAAADKRMAATFLTELFGLPAPMPSGPFMAVRLANGVTLDYTDAPADAPVDIRSQHYAFLVSDQEFDSIFARLRARNVTYYADPRHELPGQINYRDNGRGLYFDDPNGHNLEILTRSATPSASWGTRTS